MKRCISILLTMTMILSLAGCSKKTEETKKKKKPKKTTDTEVTETEAPTESTKETSDTSDTSETEESTDPTGLAKPTGPVHVQMDHDLSFLELEKNSTDIAYAELAENVDNDVLIKVVMSCEEYSILTPGYDIMNRELSSVLEKNKEDMELYYKQVVNSFPDLQKKITQDNVWQYYSSGMSSYVYWARADEQICSYRISRWASGDGLDEHSKTYCNYISATGDAIAFDDVVTDRAAFAEEILLNRPNVGPDDGDYAIEKDKGYQELAANIRDGKEVSFLLYPNCISIVGVVDMFGSQQELTLDISVLDLPHCVDLSYFNHTTEYYSLYPDMADSFKWDFDEDGILDTVTVTDKDGGEYGIDLSITMNGQESDTSQAPYQDEYDGLSWLYMAHTDSGFYLYVELSVEDPVFSTYVFHLNNGVFEYVDHIGQLSSYPYNPEDVGLDHRCEILGTGHMTERCTLIGGDGIPVQTDPFIEKSSLGVTAKKMTLGVWIDGQPTGDPLPIPEGTPVRVLGINPDQELVYFTTLNVDPSENIEFQMVLRKTDYGGYDVTYNGEGSYQLFRGAFYYD